MNRKKVTQILIYRCTRLCIDKYIELPIYVSFFVDSFCANMWALVPRLQNGETCLFRLSFRGQLDQIRLCYLFVKKVVFYSSKMIFVMVDLPSTVWVLKISFRSAQSLKRFGNWFVVTLFSLVIYLLRWLCIFVYFQKYEWSQQGCLNGRKIIDALSDRLRKVSIFLKALVFFLFVFKWKKDEKVAIAIKMTLLNTPCYLFLLFSLVL